MYVSVVCATFASCCASLYNKPIYYYYYYEICSLRSVISSTEVVNAMKFLVVYSEFVLNAINKDSATILSIRTTVSLTFDASSWRRLANAATICSLRQYEIATSIASISYKPHTNAPAICSTDQIAAVSSEIMCLLLPRFGALQVCLLYTAVEHEHEIGSCVIVELTAGTSKDNR